MLEDGLPTLSVIIANFNYARFIGASIESALSIDWPRVEVIVVDDGSKDNSAQIIGSYRAHGIAAFFQENAGQAAASDRGFRESRGEFILFLDADDLAHPSIMREVHAHMREGVSKYQFQLQTIDVDGKPLGNIFPRYHRAPSPQDIKDWARRTGSYPTPPGPGNVYSRAFLDKIFPLDLTMDRAPDSYCLPAAPFMGDVITIPKPLVSYRIHDNNMAAMADLKPEKFSVDFRRALKRAKYERELLSKFGIMLSPDRHRRSLQSLSLRVASLRLTPMLHPIGGDRRMMILGDLLAAVFVPQGHTWKGQLSLFGLIAAVALMPREIARRLLEWRYVPARRPAMLKKFVRAM